MRDNKRGIAQGRVPPGVFSILVILIAFATISFMVSEVDDVIMRAEHRELEKLYLNARAEVMSEARLAGGLATLVANVEPFARRFAEGDRRGLTDVLEPVFEVMHERYSAQQFQFHLPPAESFLRLHRPEKYGDDLSSFRKTVLKSNHFRDHVSGIEKGIAGLGIRGVAPVFYQDKHYGSVEFGMSLGRRFFDSFKRKYGADISLYVDEYRDFLAFASTISEPFLTTEEMREALQKPVYKQVERNGNNYAVYANAMKDFSGASIGVLELVIDRNYYADATHKTWLVAVIIGVVALLSSIVISIMEFKVRRNAKAVYQSNKELTTALEQVKAMQSQLVEQEKMSSLGQLVSGIAHEINTPIGVCVTACSAMQDKVEVFEQNYRNDTFTREKFDVFMMALRSAMGMVSRNLNRASLLVKNFKMIAVEQTSEDVRHFNLCNVISQLFEIQKQDMKYHGVTYQVDVPADIEMNSYQTAVVEVFDNLIRNSIIHGFKGMAGHSIRVDGSVDGENVVLRYQDNGVGVTLPRSEKIFEPFYTTRRDKECVGLGLSIVYNLVVHCLQGHIRIVEDSEHGLCFEITLMRDLSEKDEPHEE